MPHTGKMWRHVIISTRRSWLHGDPRGFRSRRPGIHSSGDYKNSPPPGEHSGLHEYHKSRSKGDAIKIPKAIRAEVGMALLHSLLAAGYRVLVIAVTAKHADVLVELPEDLTTVKRIIGKCKTARTPAIRRALPGSIWGEGGKYKRVRTRAHQLNAFKYILEDQGPGAWTWTFFEMK